MMVVTFHHSWRLVIPLPMGEVKRTCSIKVTLLKGAEVGPGLLDSIESCPLLRQATRILGQGEARDFHP